MVYAKLSIDWYLLKNNFYYYNSYSHFSKVTIFFPIVTLRYMYTLQIWFPVMPFLHLAKLHTRWDLNNI